MPIQSTDIQIFYASGQTGLTGQTGSRTTGAAGGNISITQVTDNVVNNLFPDITGDEAAAGVTKYCKIFVKNTNGSLTWQTVKGWVSSITPGTDNEIAIALEATANDLTPPISGSFSTPTTKGAGLTLGNIASNATVGIWVRWVVNAGATAKANEAGTIRFEGDTAA
jgi:hypothetical protein